MFYLLLAILSSAMISVVMRLSNGRIKNEYAMFAVNYLCCTVLGIGFTGFGALLPAWSAAKVTYLLGALDGVIFVAALVVMNANIRKNGVVLANVFMRLGLLVPLGLSIVLYGERPTMWQIAGIVLALGGMIVINLKPDDTRARSVPLLFMHFLLDGFGSAMSKIYQESGNAAYPEQFVLYTFAAAFLICCAVVAFRRKPFGKAELLFGLLIGIPNFFASRFLLSALAEMPAVIAYPTRGVLCLVIITVVGIAYFREKLQKHQWAALASVIAAVALLNL